MEQLPLFAPVGPAEPSPELRKLAKKLDKRLYLGTSSWSFPGWKDIVYDRKVSQSTLARHGLEAYARHPLFRTVGIDRTYYGPISKDAFARYARAVPEGFRFVVKAHELVTRGRLKDDPTAPNPVFLDPGYARDEVVGPCLEALGTKAAVILFQFPPQHIDSPAEFTAKLHRFLEAQPQDLLYAVELRNPELLHEGYVEALNDVGATHCFNVHPTMPPVEEQARRLSGISCPTVVVRWMLRRNRTYGDAKDTFSPFDRLAEPDDEARRAIADLVRAAKRSFVIANNKAEGSAPLSLVRLAEEISR